MKKLFERLKKIDVFSKKTYGVLYSAALLCIVMISVSQIGLRNSSTRGYFTQIDSYEGAYFEVTANLDNQSEYTLTLNVEGEGLEDALILLNGEPYSALTIGDNEVKIYEDSVVEVQIPDGTATVKITDFSEELVLYTSTRELIADKGITLCGRVGIK